MKAIEARLQAGTIVLVKQEELQEFYENTTELLQAIEDKNYGIASNIADNLQGLVNQLLPQMDSLPPIEDEDTDECIRTPIGDLNLRTSMLGNMLNFTKFRNQCLDHSGDEKVQSQMRQFIGFED